MEQRSEFGHVDTNALSLEGWMKYSTFSLDYSVIQSGLFDDGTNLRDVRYYFGLSKGMATNTNPVSGSATWRGVMVGGQVSPDSVVGDVVQGDATLIFDFTNVDMDVVFYQYPRSQQPGGITGLSEYDVGEPAGQKRPVWGGL